MDEKVALTQRSLSRRRALKVGAAVATGAIVWSEPTIKGLVRRPAYAQANSGATCSDPVLVTVPFSFDGVGAECWEVNAADVNFVNSWNMTSLTINGVDFTNAYASQADLPPPINGSYFIEYDGPFPWSHFEVM